MKNKKRETETLHENQLNRNPEQQQQKHPLISPKLTLECVWLNVYSMNKWLPTSTNVSVRVRLYAI